jgi:hypothetical protein
MQTSFTYGFPALDFTPGFSRVNKPQPKVKVIPEPNWYNIFLLVRGYTPMPTKAANLF